MRPPSAGSLLDIWERGTGRTWPERALLLLSAADPGRPRAELSDLSVGERDARLLTLRSRIVGENFVGRADCPSCASSLDLAFGAPAIRVPPGSDPKGALSIAVNGYDVAFRVPTGTDLVALGASVDDVESGCRFLLERCVLGATYRGEPVGSNALPEFVVEEIETVMAAADPGSDIELAMECPDCGHRWSQAFDVGAYLWREVEAWSVRTLREVHSLALAYGWTEAEALVLSPQRRQRYLEMLGA